MFDTYDNANEFLKNYAFVERLRVDLEKVNDVIQWFYSQKYTKKSSNINYKSQQILSS